ncbi:TetR/AcrR family transcriptional regulator [Povalibacter sp.]|uniref:TetR/AcrR family transcriptional regulator n=1 Tax=Povalibacter sp. TaxID=1962978 RepID=UPI002F4295B3
MRKTETSPARAVRRHKVKAPVREDGAQTRRQLLEVAGQVFAAQGYERATSKEICRRAGANIAAVNYHFGGKDGLYAAVLEEAHARLISIDVVASATGGKADPATKLRTLLSRIVGEIASRDGGAWELRILSREILSPTPLMGPMLSNQVAPKAKLVRAMIGDVLELPSTHPAVSRTVISLMGPCVMLLMVSKDVLGKVLPALDLDAPSLVEHLVTFAVGGMKAVAAKAKKR